MPAAAYWGVMCQIRLTALVGVCLVLLAPTVHCDSWAGPTISAITSPDGNRVIRVVPGESIGDTVGFYGEPKGPFAQATYYERDSIGDTYQAYMKISLLNPVAPLDVFLNDDGVLVTLDNWHNMGYGAVVAIFDTKGALVKSFRLEDLYPADRIADISHSVSSRWWRCPTDEPRIIAEWLWIADTIGGQFKIDLRKGTFAYEQERVYCPGH